MNPCIVVLGFFCPFLGWPCCIKHKTYIHQKSKTSSVSMVCKIYILFFHPNWLGFYLQIVCQKSVFNYWWNIFTPMSQPLQKYFVLCKLQMNASWFLLPLQKRKNSLLPTLKKYLFLASRLEYTTLLIIILHMVCSVHMSQHQIWLW